MPYPDGRPQLVTKPAGCTPEVTARFAAWLREVEVVKGWVAAAWDGERWLWRLTPLGQYVLDLLRGMGGAVAAMAAQEAAS